MNIKNTIIKTFYSFVNGAKHHAPEILMGAGTVFAVEAMYKTGKAAIAINNKADEHFRSIQELKDNKDAMLPEVYSKHVVTEYKEVAKTFAKNGAEPAIYLGAALGCFYGAYGIQKNTIADLSAATTVLYGALQKEKAKNANKNEDTDTAESAGEAPRAIYDDNALTMTFDKTCSDFSCTSDEDEDLRNNLDWAENRENYWNSQLPVLGEVTVNQVRKSFGKKPIPGGNSFIWRVDPNDPYNSKHRISFGIDRNSSAIKQAFYEYDRQKNDPNHELTIRNVFLTFNAAPASVYDGYPYDPWRSYEKR